YGAVDGQVAGMEPGYLFARCMGFDELSFDLVQGHRSRVDDSCPGGAVSQQLGRYHRSCVQADGAAGQQIPATNSNQIRGSWAGTYKVNCHGVVVSARAQVTGPTTTRAWRRRGVGLVGSASTPCTDAAIASGLGRPASSASAMAPASAAASATD